MYNPSNVISCLKFKTKFIPFKNKVALIYLEAFELL